MPFQPKNWQNFPGSTATPLSEANLEDMEIRLSDYTDQQAGLAATFNVKSYGALGDNAANDTAEIQAAVTACAAAGGGDVFVPAGIYRISSAISIPNFVNLVGMGDASVLRCTGNTFAVNFNPANRSSASGLRIEAVSSQSAGGAFDFTNAEKNIRVDNIYLGNNLHTGFNMAATGVSSPGIWTITRITWNGPTGSEYGMVFGDGTHLITDIRCSHLVGDVGSAADMTQWLLVRNNVDTLIMSDSLFLGGGQGGQFGVNATGAVTGMKLTNVVMDGMDAEGFHLLKVRGAVLTSCDAQTCGSASTNGINVGDFSVGTVINGGVVQNNVSNGIGLIGGSLYTTIANVLVSDNNTGNTASRDGISVAANTSRFKILGCTSGNSNLLATGHQKAGIRIAAGTSDAYVIVGNDCSNNETSNPVIDGGTGVNKYLAGNL